MPSLAVSAPAASSGPARAPQAAAAQHASPFRAQLAGMLSTTPGISAGAPPAGPQAATGNADGTMAAAAAATPPSRPGAAPLATDGAARPAQARAPSRRPSDPAPDAASTPTAASTPAAADPSWPAGLALAGTPAGAVVAPERTSTAAVLSTGQAAVPAQAIPSATFGDATGGPDVTPPAGQTGTNTAGATTTKAGPDMPAAASLSPAIAPANTAPDTRANRPSSVAGRPPATARAPHGAGDTEATAPCSTPAPATMATTADPASAAMVHDAPPAPGSDAAAPRTSAGTPDRHRGTPDTTASTPAVPLATPPLADVATQTGAIPVPTPASTSADAATSPATAPLATNASPTPARQAMNALVSLGGSQGTHHVTVRLDPGELGRLQIRIEQSSDGTARVSLTADRSQTLDLLVRDRADLHHALDQAGVPAEGRTVTFHLAAAAPDTSADPSRTSLPPATHGSAAGDPASGGGRGGAQQEPPRDGVSAGQPRRTGGDTDPHDTLPRTARWLRTGIDITA